jgi:hypothetical protein
VLFLVDFPTHRNIPAALYFVSTSDPRLRSIYDSTGIVDPTSGLDRAEGICEVGQLDSKSNAGLRLANDRLVTAPEQRS